MRTLPSRGSGAYVLFMFSPDDADRLATYPYVVVRVGCSLCKRQGQYRLARLAAKYGPDIFMMDLLDRLAMDCPWRAGPGQRRPGKYHPKCAAEFVDLKPSGRSPPDLPPAMMGLRVIAGGKDSP